jgi:hypothetical protein
MHMIDVDGGGGGGDHEYDDAVAAKKIPQLRCCLEFF